MRITTSTWWFHDAGAVWLVLATAAMATAGDHDGSGYSFKTVAKSGQSVGNLQFVSPLQPGAINNLGEIAFAPSLQTGGESVFLANIFGLTKLRAAGDPLPGGGTFGYNLGPVGITPAGGTAFISLDLTLPTPYGLGSGVYRIVFGIPIPIPVLVPNVTRAPDGSVFRGAAFNAQINSRDEIVFPGIICSGAATKAPSPGCGTGKQLAFGIYQADILGHIRAIVEPGSPAPGGSTFDYAQVPFNNNFGDVAFDAHVYSDACTDSSGQQGNRIFCDESVYLKNGRTGAIVSIAHQGQDSPVRAEKYELAFGPVLNDLGELVFLAKLSGTHQNGVFLYSQGNTVTIAKPGDKMPGNEVLRTAGGYPQNAYLNNNREVAFIGTLTNGEQGLYVWKDGKVTLVAKSGTAVDGGVIANFDDFGASAASTQIASNDRGQIIFAANLNTGVAALVVASPR